MSKQKAPQTRAAVAFAPCEAAVTVISGPTVALVKTTNCECGTEGHPFEGHQLSDLPVPRKLQRVVR